MRKEPFGVGSVVHVVKRGTRGLPIVRDEEDRERFLLMLLHFNDTFTPLNWFRDLTIHSVEDRFLRPDIWPQKEKLVQILAFCLLDNHFHLLLEEIAEGGIARFMHRLGIGMAKSFNEKYRESGALFQGSYRAKTIDDDVYLRYVSAYIQVKNTLEMSSYDNIQNDADFLKGYGWAATYPYSSLMDYVGKGNREIVDRELLSQMFTPSDYQQFSCDVIRGRAHLMQSMQDDLSGVFE